MAPRADRLPVGIMRVHPHTRRRLRTPADLAARKNWVWRVRAKRKGAGAFDQLYPQNIRETTRAALDHLQQVRANAINDLLRDAARGQAGIFKNDIPRYLLRRASVTDYQIRAYNLGLWEEWLRGKLGASFLTSKITPALVELALEEWKGEMVFRKKRQQRRWASATLRTRALHLSNLFVVLYPHLPNPVLAIKDRLPPKSPAVEKAQPMSVVMALLEALRTPTLTQKRQHPTFMSVRAAVLAFAGITLQELWSIRDARAFDLRAAVLRIPAKRVVERYTTKDGHGVVRVETRREQAREVKLGPEALEACRQYLAYPESYGSITRIKLVTFAQPGSAISCARRRVVGGWITRCLHSTSAPSERQIWTIVGRSSARCDRIRFRIDRHLTAQRRYMRLSVHRSWLILARGWERSHCSSRRTSGWTNGW
jgi:integrase